ncbi:MdBV-16 [Microplitis demolitor]|uniref:hypothetical protein n=1 Tax=Microplitis demolitor TaxID=69319 RepID=UPI00043FFE40|nr:hypothetical protein [Microplitis demolitor]KAG6558427.1 MdBV-16 [Microplitis demolitor]
MSAFFIDKRRDKIRYKQLDDNFRGYNLSEYINVATIKGDCFVHYFYATPINSHTLKSLKHNHVDRLACIYINKINNKILFIRYDGLAKTFDDTNIVAYDYWTISDTTLIVNDNNSINYYIEKINREELILSDNIKNSLDDYEYVGYAHWRYFDRGILYYGTRFSYDTGIINALKRNDDSEKEKKFLESFIMYVAVHDNKVLWSQIQINDFAERFHINNSENITVILPER